MIKHLIKEHMSLRDCIGPALIGVSVVSLAMSGHWPMAALMALVLVQQITIALLIARSDHDAPFVAMGHALSGVMIRTSEELERQERPNT